MEITEISIFILSLFMTVIAVVLIFNSINIKRILNELTEDRRTRIATNTEFRERLHKIENTNIISQSDILVKIAEIRTEIKDLQMDMSGVKICLKYNSIGKDVI